MGWTLTCCSRPVPFWLIALLILLPAFVWFLSSSFSCSRLLFSANFPRKKSSKIEKHGKFARPTLEIMFNVLFRSTSAHFRPQINTRNRGFFFLSLLLLLLVSCLLQQNLPLLLLLHAPRTLSGLETPLPMRNRNFTTLLLLPRAETFAAATGQRTTSGWVLPKHARCAATPCVPLGVWIFHEYSKNCNDENSSNTLCPLFSKGLPEFFFVGSARRFRVFRFGLERLAALTRTHIQGQRNVVEKCGPKW